ncbi:hypothetical protein BKA70DRAFT_1402742 [Coprinopsis sp. MPI-PUGE-AT-0042]|nr:hypothetical protein BKA70DRAFT_1402742 [Coprinopsis sp. MPI-PUGE-AT-0042]
MSRRARRAAADAPNLLGDDTQLESRSRRGGGHGSDHKGGIRGERRQLVHQNTPYLLSSTTTFGEDKGERDAGGDSNGDETLRQRIPNVDSLEGSPVALKASKCLNRGFRSVGWKVVEGWHGAGGAYERGAMREGKDAWKFRSKASEHKPQTLLCASGKVIETCTTTDLLSPTRNLSETRLPFNTPTHPELMLAVAQCHLRASLTSYLIKRSVVSEASAPVGSSQVGGSEHEGSLAKRIVASSGWRIGMEVEKSLAVLLHPLLLVHPSRITAHRVQHILDTQRRMPKGANELDLGFESLHGAQERINRHDPTSQDFQIDEYRPTPHRTPTGYECLASSPIHALPLFEGSPTDHTCTGAALSISISSSERESG